MQAQQMEMSKRMASQLLSKMCMPRNINKVLFFFSSFCKGPTKMRKSRKMRKDAQIPSKMRKDVCKFYSEGFANFTRY